MLGMDRSYWYEHGEFVPGEKVLFQQGGIRLYDGEERVRQTQHCVCVCSMAQYVILTDHI